jgi:hypothetical protein
LRKSNLFLGLLATQVLFVVLVFLHATYTCRGESTFLAAKKELVTTLGITDLCLFTEANYTRHLSQADIHTPFQDHPFSLEHFPSGSMLMPPSIVRRINVMLD